jgi:hypothetical protein
VPSALKYFDLPDVIAALAPRKVAIFNGVNPLGQELSRSRLRQEYARVQMPVEIAVWDREEQPFVPLVEPFLNSPAK